MRYRDDLGTAKYNIQTFWLQYKKIIIFLNVEEKELSIKVKLVILSVM